MRFFEAYQLMNEVHGLETLLKMNKARDTGKADRPVNQGEWDTDIDEKGIVTIMKDGKTLMTVDVHNPLNDNDLVKFHLRVLKGDLKNVIPLDVAHAVEMHASQWRRIVSADEKWDELQKELK